MTATTEDLRTTVEGVLAELAALGTEQVKQRNSRMGAGPDQFGVKMGDIRKVAAKFKKNHELGLVLWATGNIEARLLALLIMEPRKLSSHELDSLVRVASFTQLADWLNSYVVKNHPDKEALRVPWMDSDDPWAARAGWNLTAERTARSPEGLDLPALLSRIEAEMADAQPAKQWTMNNCLAGIGIHHPNLRQRAIAIGEKLGIYRDYPVPKGCTSPFAPIWIGEMAKRESQQPG